MQHSREPSVPHCKDGIQGLYYLSDCVHLAKPLHKV